MTKCATLLVLVSTLVTSTAVAQPGQQALTFDPPPAAEKSEATATSLSLLGTLGSVGLIAVGAVMVDSHNTYEDSGSDVGSGLMYAGAAGLLVAPSFGHWYAGDYLTPGLGMRLGGAGGMLLGLGMALSSSCFGPCDGGESSADTGNGGGGAGIFFVSAGVFVAGAIYDIATADNAVRAYNAKLQVRLAPTAIATPSGTASGFALTGRF